MFPADFNDPGVSNWDVSRITSMTSSFKGARAFNQDLSAWEDYGGIRSRVHEEVVQSSRVGMGRIKSLYDVPHV